LSADQKTCAPATLTFRDSSVSFGSILKWDWDFGDGTSYTGGPAPPPHDYPVPGYYTVKLNILGNNGCLSDTFRHQITIGSKPQAAFTTSPKTICADAPAILYDASRVQYGSISEWDWDFNPGESTIRTGEPLLSKTFPAGQQQIRLTTITQEGCISDPYSVSINVTKKPVTNISVEDACYGSPVHLDAENINPAVPIRQWYWLTGDGGSDSGSSVIHYYPMKGEYPVRVFAENTTGCSSDTLHAVVNIYQTRAKAGNDTTIAFDQPLQLHASGGDLYEWTPATGLSDPGSPDPVATLNTDMEYVVAAYTSFGCPTYDSIFIKAYKGPDIYVPNAFTPDHNGRNDRFHAVSAGIVSISYFNIYNRTGQLVYSSHNSSEGWDGTRNGEPQPAGTYVWEIKGEDYLGKTHMKKGTVVLIK
jgi:gliding motility-associated-like protein